MFDAYANRPNGKPEHVESFDTLDSAIHGLLEFWHEEESEFRLCHVMNNDHVVATLFSGNNPEIVTVTEQRDGESIVAMYRVRYILSDGQYLSTEIRGIGFNKVHQLS